MKTYAKSIWWLLIITIVALILLISCNDFKIVYDISLAVFGSSLITLIISIIGYRTEKIKTMEAFYKAVYKRVVYYNTYLKSWTTEDKCNFFINHYLKDFPSIGDSYADIYFFFDFKKNNKKYIFNCIYRKCKEMIDSIDFYYFNFATYLNKTGENKKSIEQHIEELENKLFEVSGINVKSDFSDKIMNELNGKYYNLLYGHEYKEEMNEKK